MIADPALSTFIPTPPFRCARRAGAWSAHPLAEQDAQPALAVTTPIICSRRWNFGEGRKGRHPGDSGVQLTIDFATPKAARKRAARKPGKGRQGAQIWFCSRKRDRLSQSDASVLARLSLAPLGEPPCVTLADLASDGAELIALTGGPTARSTFRSASRASTRLGAARSAGGAVRTGFMSKSSATASRRSAPSRRNC